MSVRTEIYQDTRKLGSLMDDKRVSEELDMKGRIKSYENNKCKD